jgi:hypothetical protein
MTQNTIALAKCDRQKLTNATAAAMKRQERIDVRMLTPRLRIPVPAAALTPDWFVVSPEQAVQEGGHWFNKLGIGLLFRAEGAAKQRWLRGYRGGAFN